MQSVEPRQETHPAAQAAGPRCQATATLAGVRWDVVRGAPTPRR